MKDFIKNKLVEYLSVVDESNIVTIEKVSPNADEITRTVVFPVVKSLYKAINKLKRGELDNLTRDEKIVINKIFPEAINKKEKGFNKEFDYVEGYFRPENFFKLYSVKTLDGRYKKVSVGFFYDKNTNDIAYYETQHNGIAINIAKVNINNLNQLESTMRHELIHAADPKVIKKKIRKNIDSKEIEYDKLPYEFDSFTHEFITTIDKNLKLVEDGEIKDELITSLWFIVKSLKNGFSSKLLFREYYNDGIIRLFSENGVKSNNIKALRHNFYQFIATAENWATKPTLFDRFMKRLVRYVPYKV